MMPAFTDLTGLLGNALLIGVTVLQLPRILSLPKRYLALFTTAVLLFCLMPLAGLPLAGYLRGMVGDLSITTLVLLLLALLRPYYVLVNDKQHAHLLILAAFTAICLYPLALGIGLYDPYRLGYSNFLFIASVLFIAIATMLIRDNLVALCLALAVLAWSLGWYESSNLWDYLIDPLVALYAISALILTRLKRYRRV
jgi:hypothetical protein